MNNPGPAGVLQLQEMFQRFINLSVGLAFIAVTLMLAWAGIKFIASGGEQKALHEVWQIVTWALLGIVFLVIGWLVLLLIETVSGAPVTKFNLCYFFPGGACPRPTLTP